MIVGNAIYYTLIYRTINVPAWNYYGIDFKALFRLKNKNTAIAPTLEMVNNLVNIILAYSICLFVYTLFSPSRNGAMRTVGYVSTLFLLVSSLLLGCNIIYKEWVNPDRNLGVFNLKGSIL